MRVTPNWLNLYAPVVDGILPDALVAYGKRLITRPDRRSLAVGSISTRSQCICLLSR